MSALGRPGSELRFAAIVVLAFVVLSGLGAAHHEVWGDETQAWLIARDSATIGELYRNLRYEGHPSLWHLGLMALTRLDPSPVLMQVLHLLLAAGAVYVFARWAPFPRIPRALFAAGFFPLFEYGVLSRNYVLGMLFLFAFCALSRRRHANPWPSAVTLVLLAHACVQGVVLTIAILGSLVVERLGGGVGSRRRGWLPLLLVALGLAAAIVQVLPPEDASFGPSSVAESRTDRLKDVFNSVARTLVPVPIPQHRFWNTCILDAIPGAMRVKTALAAALMLWTLLVICGRRLATLVYGAGMIGLLAFFNMHMFGYMRHQGFLILLALAALWLSRSDEGRGCGGRLGSLSAALRRRMNVPLILILAAQAVAGVTAVGLDIAHEFSRAGATARYLRESGLADRTILADNDFTANPIAAHLARKLIYARGSREGSFIVWDRRRLGLPTQESLLRTARELADRDGRAVVLVLCGRPDQEAVRRFPARLIAVFEGAVLGHANYHVFLVEPRPD